MRSRLLLLLLLTLLLPLPLPAATGDITGLSSRTGAGTVLAVTLPAPGAGTVLKFSGTPGAPFTAALLTVGDITGLGTLLDGLAPLSHTHPASQISDGTAAGRALITAADTSAQKTLLNLSGTNTGDQTITLTGAVTGTGTGSFATTIADGSIATAKLATNPLARANHTGTQAWNTLTGAPTTLTGYGITDAQPLDSDLTAIAALTTTGYGRALLTQADAATGRSTLGLGTGDSPTFGTVTASTAFSGPGTSLTGTAAALTTGNATVAAGLSLSGGGTVTGASGAITLTASGTNQSIALTPSGTGNTSVTTGYVRLGGSTSSTGVLWKRGSGFNTFQTRNGDDTGFSSVECGGFNIYSGANSKFQTDTNAGLFFASDMLIKWSSSSTDSGSTKDTGIARNAVGVVEFNSGTAGTLRDWTARNGTLSGGLTLSKTIITPGTTGAANCNSATGRVNFAAAATSLVVTNSLASATSIITVTKATNDSTARLGAVVAGSGSFTIYMDVAPSAETAVNFRLTN